jgi:hypothetical protein
VTRRPLLPIPGYVSDRTVVQLLKKLGTAPNDAKEILGHARVATTLAIYTSGVEDDQRTALDRISGLLFWPRQGPLMSLATVVKEWGRIPPTP